MNGRCLSLFTRYGRVNFVLASRLDLLKEVQRLQVSGQLCFVVLYFERQNLFWLVEFKVVVICRLMNASYNHGQKSWDTFAFLACFPVHTGPTPALTPQTMLDACIQNFFRVSTLYRVGGGRIARKFRKWCTVLRGNWEITEKYEYCSTVPRTFVQACGLQMCRVPIFLVQFLCFFVSLFVFLRYFL